MPKTPPELTPAIRDEIRIAAGKACDAHVAETVRRFGDRPEVVATAVEGFITGAAFAVWKRRTATFTTRRFKVTLRTLLTRAITLVTTAP